MKKYRLIKEYPGSTELGAIKLTQNISIEGEYPEFWEEVVDNNPLKLEIGKTYKIQYRHCLSPVKTVTITRFTEQGFPWSDNIKGIITEDYNLIEEVKKPLFTTEDGVDIFKGDEYLFIVLNENLSSNWIIQSSVCDWDNPKKPPLGKLQFSKKEKAEEYILMNKPCLSINDILSKLCTSTVRINNLKKLVKSKL